MRFLRAAASIAAVAQVTGAASWQTGRAGVMP